MHGTEALYDAKRVCESIVRRLFWQGDEEVLPAYQREAI